MVNKNEKKTHRQKLCNAHLLLVRRAIAVGQRRQLKRRRARGHEHHAEDEDGVIAEELGLCRYGPNEGDRDAVSLSALTKLGQI